MEQLTNMFIILCFTFPKTSRESPFQIKFIHLSSHNLQGFICSRNTEPRVTDETAVHLRVRSRGKEQEQPGDISILPHQRHSISGFVSMVTVNDSDDPLIVVNSGG